jgi:hypothetical protein
MASASRSSGKFAAITGRNGTACAHRKQLGLMARWPQGATAQSTAVDA